MGAIIISFITGAIVTGLVGAFVCRKLNITRASYQKRLSIRNDELLRYKLDRAYQDGVANGRYNSQLDTDRLKAENQRLAQQCDQLRQQLGDETIFANAIANNGGAVIRMKRMVNQE